MTLTEFVLEDLVPVGELSNGRTATVLSKADRAPVLVVKRNAVLRAHGYQRLSEFSRPSYGRRGRYPCAMCFVKLK